MTWYDAPLLALDLEGSGAQDGDTEAILEIATVPIVDALPAMDTSLTTLVNPGRPITRGPWTSPGLTSQVLAAAPPLDKVAPRFSEQIAGRYLVGHNVGVDWRLLRRRIPGLAPAGLIDTLRIARRLKIGSSNSLTGLLADLDLTVTVTGLARRSQPHRALWDTVGVAVLLPVLISRLWPAGPPQIGELLAVAGVAHIEPAVTPPVEQATLF